MRIFLRILIGIFVIVALLMIFLNRRASIQREDETDYHKGLPKTIRLETGKLRADSLLDQDCTCKGTERSPDLYWQANIPDVKSFALIMTDPDVPSPAFPLFNLTHWVIYDIPATFSNLPDGLLADQAASHSAQFGKNSKGDQKYMGPCPPAGKHAYIFRVYALNKRLTSPEPLTKPQLLDAMKDHILGYGELKTYYAAQ